MSNNNPTNLRYTGTKWDGLSEPGYDAKGFCVFQTMAAGLRAGAINILNQQRLHGLDTVRAIVTKLSPPLENDTAAYVAAICTAIGKGPDDILDLSAPAMLESLLDAIVTQEIGPQKVAIDAVLVAVDAALGTASPPEAAEKLPLRFPLPPAPATPKKLLNPAANATMAGGLSGSAVVLISWLAGTLSLPLPPDVAAAFAAIGTAVIGLILHRRS